MSQRTTADIIRIVNKWQEAGFVHELTCRVDARHAALEPVEREGGVVLLCPTCGATQEEIPAFVLGSEALIDYNLSLFARDASDREFRAARQDVWFAVVVILCCAVVLPGIVGGAVYAVLGGTLGAAVAGFHARRTFRKIDALAAARDEKLPRP